MSDHWFVDANSVPEVDIAMSETDATIGAAAYKTNPAGRKLLSIESIGKSYSLNLHRCTV